MNGHFFGAAMKGCLVQVYEGEWEMGDYHGWGCFTEFDGNTYEGLADTLCCCLILILNSLCVSDYTVQKAVTVSQSERAMLKQPTPNA